MPQNRPPSAYYDRGAEKEYDKEPSQSQELFRVGTLVRSVAICVVRATTTDWPSDEGHHIRQQTLGTSKMSTDGCCDSLLVAVVDAAGDTEQVS